MITQKEVDKIHQDLDNNREVYLYYVAHNIELREQILDEHIYKSKSDFRVIKLKLTDISNAYMEYLNFINNPDQYHEETEEEYYSSGRHLVGDFTTYSPYEKYIHYYTVKNEEIDNARPFNSRMPSIIYGHKRKIFNRDGSYNMKNDPSPISLNYTNNPEYGDIPTSDVKDLINNDLLSWKYLRFNIPAVSDGVKYDYGTSDWYILDIENFPRVEKPLINVKQKCAYFLDINEAFEYMYQLRS